MDGFPRLRRLEKVFVTVAAVNGKKKSRLVRLEQERVNWMRDLAGRFSKPGALVFYLFSATSATAKVCLHLPWHRRPSG